MTAAAALSAEHRGDAIALRRVLLATLREEAGALNLPAGTTAQQIRAELDALEASAPEPSLNTAQLVDEIRALAGLLFAYRGPERRVMDRLRGQRLVLPVPGGLAQIDFRLFRDLHTIATGAWEPHNLAFMQNRLAPGDTVLDIGAHVGHFTILAASLVGDGRVLAFEPAPSNLERLRRNIALNQPVAGVEVVAAALGARAGAAQFFDDGGTGGTEFSMFGARHGSAGVAFTATIETVDDVCRARGVERVQFMKIDVEGAELEVLTGAARTLAASDRTTMLIELHPWVVPPERVAAFLIERDFSVATVAAPDVALSAQQAATVFRDGGDLVAIRPRRA